MRLFSKPALHGDNHKTVPTNFQGQTGMNIFDRGGPLFKQSYPPDTANTQAIFDALLKEKITLSWYDPFKFLADHILQRKFAYLETNIANYFFLILMMSIVPVQDAIMWLINDYK